MENESHSAQEIEKYYKSISTEALIERFEIFRKAPYKNMRIIEIQEFLKMIFLWDSPAILPVSTSQMGSSYAKLYRIRNIEFCEKSELVNNYETEQIVTGISSESASRVGSQKLNESITISQDHLNIVKKNINNQIVSVDDFWEAPADKTSMGRINDEGESLLYTASDIRTAQLETHINSGDFFILITYKMKADQLLDLSLIGTTLIIKESLSDSTKEKLAMVVRFFTEEATRNVGEDKHFYQVSNAIAKFIREYSARDIDGWAHTSAHVEIHNMNRELQKMRDSLQLTTNFCLLPDKAHEKMEIESVQICVSGEKNYALIANLETYDENGKPIFKWII